MKRKKLRFVLLLFCLVLGAVFCLNACLPNHQAGREEPIPNIIGASWNVGPATTLTRLGTGVGKSPGTDFDSLYPWSEMKLCNVADDGTITAYLGDVGFARDGSKGQVMLKIPQFYYQHTFDGKKHEFRVADQPSAGFKLHPCFIRNGEQIPYILIGAYQAGEEVVNRTTKLTSVSGTIPAVKRTRAIFREQAQNRGGGWQLVDALARNAVALLYLVEYADTDSQQVIGEGVVDDIVIDEEFVVVSGGCDYLNGVSGMAQGVNGEASVSYRGIEDLWGNVNEFVEGINIKNKERQLYIADHGFADNRFEGNYKATGIILPSDNGYVKDFAIAAEGDWLLLPGSTGDNVPENYIPDFYYSNWEGGHDLLLLAGGSTYDFLAAGLFSSDTGKTTASNIHYGARIMCIPTGFIKGTVTTESGEAIVGANVAVISGETVVGLATTGEDGTYTVSNIPPGTYTVEFSAENCSQAITIDVRVQENQTTKNVDQVLKIWIQDFTCTAKTETSAKFSWTRAVGATGLQIQQSIDGGATWTEATTGEIELTAQTVTVTGLRGVTTYKFKLVVIGGNNAGDSNAVEVKTDLPKGVKVVGALWKVGTGATLTRLGDGVGKSPGTDFNSIYPWSEMNLCNVADDGTIKAYLGDAGFKRDGSNGQVMVKIPKFCYKRIYDGQKHEFWVADQPTAGFKLHPAFSREDTEIPYILVGAYEAGLVGDKLISKTCVAPVAKRTRAEFRRLAQKRGAGWSQIDIQTWSALQLLYLIEYANWDCQEEIGKGRVSTSEMIATGGGMIATGECDDLNGVTGTVGDAVSYRGLENLWGNVWSFIEGINIKNSTREPYFADSGFTDDKFEENYQATGVVLSGEDGYCKDLVYSSTCDWLFMPGKVEERERSISDYFEQNWDGTGDKVLLAGGCWNDDSFAGLFSWRVNYSSAYTWITYGTRVLYLPQKGFKLLTK